MNTPNLTLSLLDKQKIFAAYMPFIKQGGLFIATDKIYPLGVSVLLQLELKVHDEIERYAIVVKVIWVTPAGAVNNRPAGIGIQLPVVQKDLRDKLENFLQEIAMNEELTDTL